MQERLEALTNQFMMTLIRNNDRKSYELPWLKF